MFCIVIPFSQSFDEIGFTYSIPTNLELKPGMIVLVPFGNKEILGIVSSVLSSITFDISKVKPILNIYSNDIFLNEYQLKLLDFISKYYICLAHNSLNLFFPSNLKQKLLKNKFVFKSNIQDFKYDFNYDKTLNPNQQKVFLDILNSKNNKHLMYGVTGSGKTEIYINLIKKYLDSGKQSLLLVPEIILTAQIYSRIQKVFGKDVLILNSQVSDAKKTLYFELIHQNKAKIIVGTRSSLFYPYNNLGLIIIDEEHDNSYISDISPRYDAIEVALEISNLCDVKCVLSSATPKINHMYNAMKNKFGIHNLFSEYK